MKKQFSQIDEKWMRRAIQLAEKGAGYVSPNPMVGCVIVSSDGNIIGEGYHERFGSPHAEINAINSVKDKSELVDATVYVTLEPCSHSGKTPACVNELINLPLKRIVVGMVDPNPEVNGKGLEILRNEGNFQVDQGCLEKEVSRLNEAFIHYMQFGKPFVTLKIAQTADGYVAAPDGNSKWISGKEAREKVHLWRSHYDAVMIGKTTAELDNPRLTVRHVEGRQPYRVVIDGNLELSNELNLFSDQHEEKTIVLTHNRERYENIADPMLNLLKTNYFRGETILVENHEGHTDLDNAFLQLGKKKIASVLVEAGSQLASAMIRENLVDKLHLFIAPKILGGGTRSVIGAGINRMEDIIDLHESSWEQTGNDMLLTGYF